MATTIVNVFETSQNCLECSSVKLWHQQQAVATFKHAAVVFADLDKGHLQLTFSAPSWLQTKHIKSFFAPTESFALLPSSFDY